MDSAESKSEEYVNPTYDAIAVEKEESYETLKKKKSERDLPQTPKVAAENDGSGPTRYGTCDKVQTRYLAAVIVLSVLCVLLVLAVILVYFFAAKSGVKQFIHNNNQRIQDCVTEWQTLEGLSSSGGLELILSSAGVCQSVCEGMPSCLAAEYSPTEGTCWLHTETSKLEDKQADLSRTQYVLLNRCVKKGGSLISPTTTQDTSEARTTTASVHVTTSEPKKREPSVATTTTWKPLPTTSYVARTTSDVRSSVPKDCSGYKDLGVTKNGVYPIRLITREESDTFDVYCDMDTDGGGWTTLVKREDGSVRFATRLWDDYKEGFGNIAGEYWLGNDLMYELTLNNGDQYELRFDLGSFALHRRYAKYSLLAISDENNKYKLHVGAYSGNAGNGINYNRLKMFTTPDRDNDAAGYNCAQKYSGGWWYNNGCTYAKLTGAYGNTSIYGGVMWYHWLGYSIFMKYADMKIRPRADLRGSCAALKAAGQNDNTALNISYHTATTEPKTIFVYCEQKMYGGGWMHIMKQTADTEDFDVFWADYRSGFGNVRGEFWMGLEDMHKFTSTFIVYQLLVELKTAANDIRYILYSSFKVTAESDHFRLILGPVLEGDLVDSLQINNNQPFTTKDVDNDNSEDNCAQLNDGGWWFKSCTDVLLTGQDEDDPEIEPQQKLRWKNWLNNGEEYPPIAEARMMIRAVL